MRRKLTVAALALIFLLGAWAFLLEPSSLALRKHDLVLPSWPPEQSGLVIALLSDLHVGSPYYGLEKLAVVVEEVNAESPDLVLLAGDYVIGGIPGGELVPPEAVADGLKQLSAPLGVYAVLGNHDWWFDGPRIRKSFEDAGIRVLENEKVRVQGRGFDFWLAGLGDFWEARQDIGAALDGIPEDSAPIIAFTHNPDLFPEVPGHVSLTLAGHTHGGQVRVPLVGAPIVPSRFGDRFVRGHVVEDGRHLFVTTGLGTSILPVRFGVPPEVAVLRVLSRASRD